MHLIGKKQFLHLAFSKVLAYTIKISLDGQNVRENPNSASATTQMLKQMLAER